MNNIWETLDNDFFQRIPSSLYSCFSIVHDLKSKNKINLLESKPIGYILIYSYIYL